MSPFHRGRPFFAASKSSTKAIPGLYRLLVPSLSKTRVPPPARHCRGGSRGDPRDAVAGGHLASGGGGLPGGRGPSRDDAASAGAERDDGHHDYPHPGAPHAPAIDGLRDPRGVGASQRPAGGPRDGGQSSAPLAPYARLRSHHSPSDVYYSRPRVPAFGV